MKLVFRFNGLNSSFEISDTKRYIPVKDFTKLYVTLSTQEIIKLLKQLESGFNRTINWNKYLAKTTNQPWNNFWDYLIDPGFQGVNWPFVLLFKDDGGRENNKQYYLPTVEIKDYNVMIDGRNFFDQPVKNDLKAHNNSIRKTATGQGDDYTNGCLLDYRYFQKTQQISCNRFK